MFLNVTQSCGTRECDISGSIQTQSTENYLINSQFGSILLDLNVIQVQLYDLEKNDLKESLRLFLYRNRTTL